MDTATDLTFGTSTCSLTPESNERPATFYRAVKVSLRAMFCDVHLELLGRMLPDRTYLGARQQIRETVDQYVQIALGKNRKEVMRDKSTPKIERPKQYISLDHLAERSKDPGVLRDQSISALVRGNQDYGQPPR